MEGKRPMFNVPAAVHAGTLLLLLSGVAAERPSPQLISGLRDRLHQNENETAGACDSQLDSIRPLGSAQGHSPDKADFRYFADVPDQNYLAGFMDSGMRLLPKKPDDRWQGEIRLDTNGAPDAVKNSGNYIEYIRPGIIEWYRKHPSGIEHGYTIESRETAPRDKRGRVAIPVRVDGLTAHLPDTNGKDDTIHFLDRSGTAVLSYSGLKAWDADDVFLTASLRPTENGFEILVSDLHARYPITVDPIIRSLESKIRPALSSGDFYGFSVSISGETALVGAPKGAGETETSGVVHVFIRQGLSWVKQAELSPSDGEDFDNFGWSVSLHGETAVIGAIGDNPGGNSSGAAYVFVRSGTNWVQQAKLVPSGGAANDSFGWSVSVHDDIALVGAVGDDTRGKRSGAAYIFTRDGSEWSQSTKLSPPESVPFSSFGWSVSLSDSIALIGAIGDDNTSPRSGAAYVYERFGTLWLRTARLAPADGDEDDHFGWSVAISGERALIGAPHDDDNGSESGSAYVFARSDASWAVEGKLTPSDSVAETDFSFGVSVALEGNAAVVGAANYSPGGTVYGFVWSGSAWSESSKLVPVDTASGDSFGFKVGLSGDTIVVGAYRDDQFGTTTTYVEEDSFIDEVEADEDHGSAYIYRVAQIGPDSDGDGASDTWETSNGFNPDLPYDFRSQDSDGDGRTDLTEIFQYTNLNAANGNSTMLLQTFDYQTKTIRARYRRATASTGIRANYAWSRNMVDWYQSGMDDGTIQVDFTETVVGQGSGYEIIEFVTETTPHAANELFVRIQLTPTM